MQPCPRHPPPKKNGGKRGETHSLCAAQVVASWGETLLVDEAVERLAALDALLLFEVSVT